MKTDIWRERLRRFLRPFPRVRSLYYFAVECRRALWDRSELAPARQDERYALSEDPWRYGADPIETARHTLALGMLDRWFDGNSNPAAALEIGCGEGLFTESLCTRCASVLAVDISAVALERAGRRLRQIPNVRLGRYDLRGGRAPGRFDLVVCMDVVTEIYRPIAKRRAIRKVVGCVAPGGALLVSEPLQDPFIERVAWARFMGRGALNTVEKFGESGRGLVRRDTRLSERHLLTLYVDSA
jgi:2-polyprenyl-3-methyl-5-hydroxy-6-metoxy-1,4-benzoquinol methylase